MIYLDNAATTFPKPERVAGALTSWITTGMTTPGRGNHAQALRSADAVGRVRRSLARFFGLANENRLVFCCSATDALNLGIKGFLKEGDHVLISSMEHNSVLRPLRGMEADGRINLEILPCDRFGYLDPVEVSKRWNRRTRLVVLSHASNVTGAVQPVAEIGRIVRERGGYLLVDAAQTAGILPVSLEGLQADMLAFSGHKGLFGLPGTGCLAVGERIGSLRPWREGGTGFNSLSETQPQEWPEAYEAGTPNVPGIFSLGEGLAFIGEQGIEAIHQREMEHCALLWDALSALESVDLYGPPPGWDRIAVISLNIEGWDPEDLGSLLNHNHGIHLRTGLHCSPLAHRTIGTHPAGTVRLSPGCFTTSGEIRQAINAISALARMLVPGLS
ncbi:MAG: aminotransferase class V-fold PLP-dependent enzyme [Nitrospirales bacterium]|nr:aminotransferase class V-fold PLP-dependent enzyme [Nitrospirales bacterium]